MTQALRSPGSALKPFIYGLAFEDGLVHPETLIEDRPVRYGAYAPENFDLTFQGTVSVRRALQLSLNVPAVALLDKVGASRLSARLAQAGAPLVLPKGEAPGLAMALGGVGVKLTDLTMLYAGLARGGMVLPLTERIDDRVPGAPLRLIDPVAAWYVGNVLIGTPPPEHAAGGRIAYKTGTSYGYRDAWSVGLRRTPHHRRLGRAARWRAGARADRPRRRGADPVRCLRANRPAHGAARQRAARRGVRDQRETAAAAAALPARPLAGRQRASRRCASSIRRTARASNWRCRTASPIRSRSRSQAASARSP